MREIKFRGFSYAIGGWLYGNLIEKDDPEKETPTPWVRLIHNRALSAELVTFDSVGQFTGLHDKNGKEIYEGDIFRIEEDGNIDVEDSILYVVVVWVKEWCMFATLLDYEYHDYVENGVKAIDEQMFWSYTLEDTNSQKHFLCGNIYETPELL